MLLITLLLITRPPTTHLPMNPSDRSCASTPLPTAAFDAAPARRVEIGSIEVAPHGESFVLGLVDANRDVHRMELPCWAVHELMRLLPRLDAALLQVRHELTSDLIAYPVVQASVEPTGADGAIALSLQTDRRVESAFLLAAHDAAALHVALGDALGIAAAPRVARRRRAGVSAPADQAAA
jgi:hypothetical protein